MDKYEQSINNLYSIVLFVSIGTKNNVIKVTYTYYTYMLP